MRQTMQKFHISAMSLITVFLLLLPMIYTVQAVSGSCGDGITWDLNGGVLTISGNGAMENYTEFAPAPWANYADQIQSVIIKNGVSSVGNFAFFSMEKINSVSLANSVTKVGMYAFYNCPELSLLDLGNGVKSLGESAFERCTGLTAVRLPNSLEKLSFHTFYRCESFQTITVPASVTEMEGTVFGYCYGLRSAVVLAQIQELPAWTFYGCKNLSSVTLSPSIVKTGMEAFEGCAENIQPIQSAVPKDKVEYSSTKTDDNGVTTQQQFVETPNSSVITQTTGNKTTVDAVVENADGWSEAVEWVKNADGKDVHVNIHLKGKPEVTKDQLKDIAGKDMSVTIHTQQGALWHINGADLKKNELQKKYDLSFTLQKLTDLNDAQKTAIGYSDAYTVVFHTPLDFKVEVELPLGIQYASEVATFFVPEEDGYTSMQNVRVDNVGAAHFYLGQVQENVAYLIGVDVTYQNPNGVGDAIIPDSMKEQYGNIEQVEQIEYMILGPKSSWGMDIKQVTWILAGVMGGCVVVVGIVIGVLNKQRLKKGYVPKYDDEKS